MKESLRSRQRGFNLLKLFIPVIVVAVFASILMEESPAPGNDARPAKPPTPSGPAYALGLKDNWPPMPEGKNAGAITDAAGMARANYYLILDGSGSMNDEQCSEGRRKIQVAVDAINAFTRALPKQSNFGLATFINGKNIELAPLGPDHQAGMASLGKVRPSGNTPLFSAVQFGYDKLTTQARRQSGYGEYHLVVVTDGMHSKGEDPTPAVDQLIARSPVVIHTIGFCISDKHALNQPGRTFYRSATDPASLKQGLESVLAEAPDFNIDRFEQ
jgi:Ca-activated chloride channel family protein